GNASVSGGQGVGTITNDDPLRPGSLEFSAAAFNVSENAGTLTLTVHRAGGSDGNVSAQYVVTVPDNLKLKGKATPGQDFQVALTGTFAFGTGETDKSLVITLANDS